MSDTRPEDPWAEAGEIPDFLRRANGGLRGPGGSAIAIEAIRVGERHRRDLGDIAALAESIRTVGLLHPPVVRSDGALVAGARRLAACRLLGWTEVPVHTIDLEQIVRGEFAENAHRKDFLPSEIASIMRELEPVEKAAAAQRMTLGKVSLGS